MKEQTYGWYPSQKDVYKDRRMGAPNAYQLEAMYKYRDSQYYTAPKPPSPRTPGAFRPSPSPPKRPMSTVSSQSRGTKKSSSSLQVRAKSAPIYDFKPVQRLQIPTPQQCWAMATEETNYTIPSDQPGPSPVPYSWPTPQPASPAPSFQSDQLSKYDIRSDRIKSAVIRRDRPAAPTRPVKSAGPSRETTHRSGSPMKALRPKTPSPIELEDMVPEETVPTEELYDENLKKFGWRMEVHGDPYRVKPTTKRLPYYVRCDEPDIEPEGPRVHMENLETFFLNTIPRRPATFTIHKEWVSETIHAKRMELQKREGIKHRWKNFAFVY
ncbi:uncharacterized protein LOC128189768 isoform X3 [Crassostrea angulata]|nr:uncharacterized protein LOC128189768 isoform X3 [Crassostrea angulata]XP_052717478.1 uncharacterized protein LOC128189768 isoform X3 [Crassostrea angulata]